MADDKRPLLYRVLETAVLSGAGAIVFAVITGAVALVWEKTINFDENIRQAQAGLVATQEVTERELTALQTEMASLKTELIALRETAYRQPSSNPSLQERPAEALETPIQNVRQEQSFLEKIGERQSKILKK